MGGGGKQQTHPRVTNCGYITTRRMWHTQVARLAHIMPPAVAGRQGVCVTRAARRRALLPAITARRTRMRHTLVARPAHMNAAGCGGRAGGRVACAARRRARLAAIATCEMRHTPVARPAHIPPPTVDGGRVIATRERHGDVLGSLRPRRAECGTHKWHARRNTYRRQCLMGS